MQLKHAAVCCVLLGGADAAAQAPPDHEPPPLPVPIEGAHHESPIDVRASTEFSSYADSDHVFVQTPTIAGTVSNPTAGWSVSGRYLVDIVSAASVDIVSTASRQWTEVRNAGTLNGTYKPKTFGIAANAAVSSEPDYLSLNGGAAVSQDLFAKNLTLLLGFNYGHDVAGRGTTPFSVFSRQLNRESIKAGGTLVVNRSTVASVVADVVLENGDQSKPYRYIPLFAPGVAVPIGAPIDLVNRLRTSARPLEQLPLSRDRVSVWFQLAHRKHRITVRGDERLYVDTWGLKASSTDGRVLFDVGRRFEIGPHLRLHAQTSVDFWQRAYVLQPGFDYPALRAGDRELGPLVTLTAGQSMRWAIGPQLHPRAWILGLDLNVATTRYLDDIYLTNRVSTIGALSLEAEL